MLLTASIGTPQEPQAILVANQAIQVAQREISSMQSGTQSTPQNQNNSMTEGTSTPATQEPVSLARIEIVNPWPGKGLGRQYKAAPQISDESNYIEIGAVLYNADGIVNTSAPMTVSATDSSQNKNLNGTGNYSPRVEGGYYYPFTYEFKSPGEHTITFQANGITKAVKVNAE
jgi:hypothetical protein